jgi:hypothetical protein
MKSAHFNKIRELASKYMLILTFCLGFTVIILSGAELYWLWHTGCYLSDSVQYVLPEVRPLNALELQEVTIFQLFTLWLKHKLSFRLLKECILAILALTLAQYTCDSILTFVEKRYKED